MTSAKLKATEATKAATVTSTALVLPMQATVAPNHPTAPLTPLQQARANVATKAASGLGVTLHTNGTPIKGLQAQVGLKPNASNLRYVSSIQGHCGVGNCIKRWHLYQLGNTLYHASITNGLTPNDLLFWHKCGYLTLTTPTPAQVQAAQAAFAAGQPLPSFI